MTLGHILRQLLSVALALACAHAVPVRAQHDDRAADAVQVDRTPAIRDALDAAREAAARIRNPLRSTEGMVRVADVAWDYDPETSQKTFERAFDLLMVELRAGGQRAAAARPYMEFALELYARHAWERAVDFTLLYATSYLPTTPDDRFRLATLLAGLGLDHAQTNRARAADLARRSIQTGIATTELAQLLGELDSPDRYRLVLASVRLARAQRDGLGVLLALNDRIGIVRLDEPQKLGDGSSMELAAEWLQSVRRSLARMAREAADRTADGYALSSADMDPVLRVLASRDGLLDAFKSWRTENTDRAADLLASLASSVAYIEDTASARADAARSLLPPGSWDDGDPVLKPVPALGQHSDAILAELGIDAAGIAALRAAEAV